MRIAVVVTEFPLLSETFVLNQITGLLDLGHQVDVHARFRGRMDDPHLLAYGLDRRTHGQGMPWSYYLRVLRAPRSLLEHTPGERRILIRSLDPFRFGADALSLRLFYASRPFLGRSYDVVHCHFGPNGNQVAQMKQAGIVQAPLVTTFHGYGLRIAGARSTGMYQALRREGDLFLAISSYSRKRLVEIGFEESRIVDHPMGIDPRRFPFRERGPGKAAERRPIRILSVGRLVPEKGHEVAIRAVQRVLQSRGAGRIEYTIAGDGPLRRRLSRLLVRLGLTDSVRLVGPLESDEVARAMFEADIFLHPSRAEVLPVVLMEAQAAGLPVLATDVGAVAEIVEEGITGYLVPPDDPAAMAARLERLMSEPERHPAMGRRARAIVEQRHDIRVLNPRLSRILASVAREGAPPPTADMPG